MALPLPNAAAGGTGLAAGPALVLQQAVEHLRKLREEVEQTKAEIERAERQYEGNR